MSKRRSSTSYTIHSANESEIFGGFIDTNLLDMFFEKSDICVQQNKANPPRRTKL